MQAQMHMHRMLAGKVCGNDLLVEAHAGDKRRYVPRQIPLPESVMAAHPPSGTPSLLRRAENARTVNAVGVTVRFLLTAEETGGQFALLEYTAPPAFAGPAPHWHQRTTEVFYGLEGSIRMRVGEETHALNPGDVALVPPGVVHAFQNPGTEAARFLVQITPGGLERYFVELVELIQNAPSWPLADMRPVAELARAMIRFPRQRPLPDPVFPADAAGERVNW